MSLKLKTYIYTCTCKHTWEEAREKNYAETPTKFACSGCGQKGGITFEQAPDKPRAEIKTNQAFLDPTRVDGIIKKPDGFKDVLSKVADKYKGNTINID